MGGEGGKMVGWKGRPLQWSEISLGYHMSEPNPLKCLPRMPQIKHQGLSGPVPGRGFSLLPNYLLNDIVLT